MATDWFLEEYKIVQVKIDEVLKSQFQVRSWSVTLLTAAVFGIVGTGRPPIWLVFAIPVVLIFQLLDLRQTSFRRALAARVADLESAINLLGLPTHDFDPDKKKKWIRLRETVPNLRGVPGVARTLAERSITRPRAWTRAELLFYLVQYGTIVAIVSVDVVRRVLPYVLDEPYHTVLVLRTIIRVVWFGFRCLSG
jgi:hypothetical protein